MANKAISGLTASAANLANTDLLPVVQTAGVGPVKMTGTQLKAGVLESPTITGHPTIEGVTSTGATGTGKFVFSGAPTLTNSAAIHEASALLGAGGKLTLDGNNGSSAQVALAQIKGYLNDGTTGAEAGTLVFSTRVGGGLVDRAKLDLLGNFIVGSAAAPTGGSSCFTLTTGLAPSATAADSVTFYSNTPTVNNTIPGIIRKAPLSRAPALPARQSRLRSVFL